MRDRQAAHARGHHSESVAALYLRLKGYRILARRLKTHVGEIDLVNIRQATHLAMARAVRALSVAAEFALVDGNDPPALPCRSWPLGRTDGHQ